jgi:hypothetical protein
MPFSYVVKWVRSYPESVSVEAHFRYPSNPQEKRKPAFIIGHVSGSRILTIRRALQELMERFPCHSRGRTMRILLDHDDEAAYRIGLATALLSKVSNALDMERGVRYVLTATPEEVWFWTSKWLDNSVGEKTIQALALMSGSTS